MLSRPQDHRATGWIRLIEKSSDLIRNRSRVPQACNIVPQPTTLPRAPITPCSTLKVSLRFGGTCRLHLHGRIIDQAWKQVASRTSNHTDSKEIHNLTTYTFLRSVLILSQTNKTKKKPAEYRSVLSKENSSQEMSARFWRHVLNLGLFIAQASRRTQHSG
jgi:hypothetical protein